MTIDRVYVTRGRVPDAIELLRTHFDVEVWPEPSAPPRDVVTRKAAECQAILTEIDDTMDAGGMEGSALKIVSNRAIGLDNIDVQTATRLGILVGNTPGVLHESCADFTFALVRGVARRVPYSYERVRAKEWKIFDQTPYIGVDVYGVT